MEIDRHASYFLSIVKDLLYSRPILRSSYPSAFAIVLGTLFVSVLVQLLLLVATSTIAYSYSTTDDYTYDTSATDYDHEDNYMINNMAD